MYGSQVDMCNMADVFLWLDSLEGDMGTACSLLIAQGITDIPPRTVYCDCYDLVPDEMAEEKFLTASSGLVSPTSFHSPLPPLAVWSHSSILPSTPSSVPHASAAILFPILPRATV